MATFVYRCPSTGLNVQGWAADDPSENNGSPYRTVTCVMCQRVHVVNPSTGKLLSEDR